MTKVWKSTPLLWRISRLADLLLAQAVGFFTWAALDWWFSTQTSFVYAGAAALGMGLGFAVLGTWLYQRHNRTP